MKWSEGKIYGVDASSWLTAVQSALAAEQMGQSFSSRLQQALENGHTSLPDLTGSFVLEKGFLNFVDIQGKNNLISISSAQMEISPMKSASHIKMPIILTSTLFI